MVYTQSQILGEVASTLQVVGIEKLVAFFRYCFLGQGYYVTDPASQEHVLWDHKVQKDEPI